MLALVHHTIVFIIPQILPVFPTTMTVVKVSTERIGILFVTMQLNQIATAAEQQTSTTSEISNNIHSITEAMNSSAEVAREGVDAAGQLTAVAEDLKSIVGQFKVSA